MLSGGPTAKLCYEHLTCGNDRRRSGRGRCGRAGDAGSGTVPTAHPAFDWSLVDIYMGDERLVPPDDEDANQRLVREAIVDRVGILGSFTPMPTTGPVEECVADYQRRPGRRPGRAGDRPHPSGHGGRRPHGLALPPRPHPRGAARPAGGGDRRIPNGQNAHPG